MKSGIPSKFVPFVALVISKFDFDYIQYFLSMQFHVYDLTALHSQVHMVLCTRAGIKRPTKQLL